eukprot:280046_1
MKSLNSLLLLKLVYLTIIKVYSHRYLVDYNGSKQLITLQSIDSQPTVVDLKTKLQSYFQELVSTPYYIYFNTSELHDNILLETNTTNEISYFKVVVADFSNFNNLVERAFHQSAHELPLDIRNQIFHHLHSYHKLDVHYLYHVDQSCWYFRKKEDSSYWCFRAQRTHQQVIKLMFRNSTKVVVNRTTQTMNVINYWKSGVIIFVSCFLCLVFVAIGLKRKKKLTSCP